MHDTNQAIERLTLITSLIAQARDIADREEEHMLGAKLDDCLSCTEQRISSLQT